MRHLYYIIVLSALALAQSDCPKCDLPLKGFTIGGFIGAGTFSADSDSPTVAEAMGIDELPPFAMRAGAGMLLYPGGRYRLGLLGGYNRASSGEDEKFIRAEALWGALTADLIRTSGAFNVTGGIGVGGGIARVKGCEVAGSLESSESVPMVAVLPRFGFELALGNSGAISLEFSYLWFFGEEKTVEWQIPDIGSENSLRQMVFSPIEIGGPSLTLGLQLGKIARLKNENLPN